MPVGTFTISDSILVFIFIIHFLFPLTVWINGRMLHHLQLQLSQSSVPQYQYKFGFI